MKKNILVILLGVSLIFNVIIMRRLNSVEQSLNSISSQYHGIMSSVNSVNREVRSIKEGEKWVSTIEFIEDTEVASAESTVLNVNVVFRELEKEENPSLSLKNLGSEEVIDVPLIKSSGLIYSCEIKVDRLERYEYTVYSEGQKLRSGDRGHIPYNIYGLPEFGVGSGIGPKWFNLDIHFNNIPHYEGLRPEEVILYIRDNGKNLKSYKLEHKKVKDENEHDIPKEELLRYWYITVNREEFDFKVDYKAFIKVKYKGGLEKETDITDRYIEMVRGFRDN